MIKPLHPHSLEAIVKAAVAKTAENKALVAAAHSALNSLAAIAESADPTSITVDRIDRLVVKIEAAINAVNTGR